MTSSVPKTMKGVSIPKTGGVEVLDYRDDLPVPEPKEGEMLVKNDFVGVNFIDTYVPMTRPQGFANVVIGTCESRVFSPYLCAFRTLA